MKKNDILKSWKAQNGINTIEELLNWIRFLNESTHVNISECASTQYSDWRYDAKAGNIHNQNNTFFSIEGVRRFINGKCVKEQPIINQPEIGYLGIICRKINGIVHFLMQGKIEPGNVNCVQISPTIQATKSNFTRAHGGRSPNYLDYFLGASKYNILYDQVQSEQAARFFRKRNRNIIIEVDEDIPILFNYRWMTLGQIKELMKIDNLVNMDTRTVLSGLPLIACNKYEKIDKNLFNDIALYNSIYKIDPLAELPVVYQKINNFKMMTDVSVKRIRLDSLKEWKLDEYGITCSTPADFSVRYYDIEIEGREVLHWQQPLFKAIGKATFGLLTKNENGVRKFLVKLRDEIGSFDGVELGPSIQWEPTQNSQCQNNIELIFNKLLTENHQAMCDVVLSEEGGRFFHEQNRNVIFEIEENDIEELPDEYMWLSYSTLNYMIQINNCLNIQLRNLLSLIPM